MPWRCSASRATTPENPCGVSSSSLLKPGRPCPGGPRLPEHHFSPPRAPLSRRLAWKGGWNLLRWNAAAMVLKAFDGEGVGGHIATTFLRRRSWRWALTTLPRSQRRYGDQPCFGPRGSGVYACAFRGRFEEGRLRAFRRELTLGRLIFLPTPRRMTLGPCPRRPWAFPPLCHLPGAFGWAPSTGASSPRTGARSGVSS